MRKTKVAGFLLALVLAAAPGVYGGSAAKPLTVDAAQKHYYVLSCDHCYAAYSTGILGKLLVKSHVKNQHGVRYYTKKDVCTAMGCHTSKCDNNNQRIYF